MGNLKWGDVPLSAVADADIVAQMNESRPNRLRNTTANLWLAVLRVFDDVGPPMTVRQVFYALTSRGAVPKTEAGYRKTAYHVLQMRRAGVLPYDYVSDATRWMRKPETFSGLDAYLEHGRRAYRRALWDNQNDYLEIWLEKDALAGVVSRITEQWDVPLMVTRGYPSETFVFEAAEAIKARGKPTWVYAFYDYDPSGQDIAASTARKLRAFGADIRFELVAVKREQIQTLGLPTRPTKRADTRARGWSGGSVELDAIPVNVLREMVEGVITRHIDQAALEWTRRIEAVERELLSTVQENLGLVQSLAA